ncbi:MAG: DEAD/DEAH box helicase [Caldilineaceae bacterium]|nr:DEAD/DEAH box helicase [Caldilineaceae bacterium]
MSIGDVIAELGRDRGFMANVTAWETLPARAGQLVELPEELHPVLRAALRRRGIERLYSHQAEAVTAALAGDPSVTVVTPTASGKTLCYVLPVLHALLRDPDATALFLFPTKALAHDQLAEIGDWIGEVAAFDGAGADGLARAGFVAAYDGDTPVAERRPIRQNARAVLSNPDMLHAGVLPYHGEWARFFAGLRYVIIDEMHSYRGVFGSHVANVLRRLRRVAGHYGSHPQFLLTSATIANPQQLAESLSEHPVKVVDNNGAPQGRKHIVLYAPPLYDPIQGLRRSSVLESQELAVRFLKGGLQTIVFGRARLTVELLLSYIREGLQDDEVGDGPVQMSPGAVRGYRGGYLPQERRQIEAGLRSGSVRGVVATNALELGIDIGQLEAAVICGYPGTIAAAWQQWGRVGRTTGESMAVLVATAGALDQYVVNNPHYLLQRSPERAFANADNLVLLVDQMRCAAFELPFAEGDHFGRSPFTEEVLDLLAEEKSIQQFGSSFLWQGGGYPSRQFGLRSVGGEPVVVQAGSSDRATSPGNGGREERGARRRRPGAGVTPNQGEERFTVVGEVDAANATLQVHEGAVYIHEGRSFLVEKLDLEERQAWVWPAEVEYYTEASGETEIEVISVQGSRVSGGAELGYGEIFVTSQVTQYRRVRRFTHENLGILPLDYPPTTLDTAGYWLEVTSEAQEALMEAGNWRDSPNDYGPDWQEQRAKTRERDGFRCAECGADETRNRQHDVHHRVPFRVYNYIPGLNRNDLLANSLNNLVLLCRRCHHRMEAGVRARTGMDGVAYALGNLAPLHLMCDRRDIDVAIIREQFESRPLQHRMEAARPPSEEEFTAPRIYIYERIPAGIGFSAQLYERHDELMAGAADLIRSCGCRYGCPACVGPVLLVDSAQLAGGQDSKQANAAAMPSDSGEEVEFWDDAQDQSRAQVEPRPLLETKQLALALLAALAGD